MNPWHYKAMLTTQDVEAIEFHGWPAANYYSGMPTWFNAAVLDGTIYCTNPHLAAALQQWMMLTVDFPGHREAVAIRNGDWIVKLSDGSLVALNSAAFKTMFVKSI